MIAARLAAGALAAAIAVAAAAADVDEDQRVDEQRTLEGVDITGVPLPEIGPQTGKVLLRPLVYNPRGGGAINTLRQVEFVFAPVDIGDDGRYVLSEAAGLQRRSATMRIPEARGFSGRLTSGESGFRTIDIDLPAGAYTLSEIRYYQPDTRRPLAGSLAGQFEDQVSFCLSKRSVVFDIENGETAFFGRINLATIVDNRARFRHHTPVISLSQDPAHLNGPFARRGDVGRLDLEPIAFDPEIGVCSAQSYNVAAWRQDAETREPL